MKERPILFSAPMVRALLAGTKTQTRRVVKPVGKDDGFVILNHRENDWPYRSDDGEVMSHTVRIGDKPYSIDTPHDCPYGKPGDRLWVRETGWERPDRTPRMMREGADTWDRYYYDADGYSDADHEEFKEWGFRRRPSIHMPRWASRLILDVTAIRVERLQDISEADCRAEGLGDTVDRAHHWYRVLWEQINGAGSWDANPWVWVVEFQEARP